MQDARLPPVPPVPHHTAAICMCGFKCQHQIDVGSSQGRPESGSVLTAGKFRCLSLPYPVQAAYSAMQKIMPQTASMSRRYLRALLKIDDNHRARCMLDSPWYSAVMVLCRFLSVVQKAFESKCCGDWWLRDVHYRGSLDFFQSSRDIVFPENVGNQANPKRRRICALCSLI